MLRRAPVLAVAGFAAVAFAGPLAAQAAAATDTAPRAIPNAVYLSRLVQRLLPDRAVAAESSEEQLVAIFADRYSISRDLAQTIVTTALAEGLDPDLAFRVVRVESVFSARARGPSGSLGLMQLMPGTARALDRTLRSEAEILEPRTNLRLGMRYLRGLIERYGGDVRLGLLAYNRGEGAVDRALRRGADPGNGYASKVLGGNGVNRYRGPGLLRSARR